MFEYTLRNFNKIRDAVKEQPFNFKSISNQCFQKYIWSSVGPIRLLETEFFPSQNV